MKPVMTKDEAKALEAKVEDHTYSNFWEKTINAVQLVGKNVRPQQSHRNRRHKSHRNYKHSFLWNNFADRKQLNILDYIEYENKAEGVPITAKEERNNPGNFRMSVPDEGDGHHFHSVEITTVPQKEDPKHTGTVFYKFQNHRAFKEKYTHNGIDPLGNFMLMVHNHFNPEHAIDPRLNKDLAQKWTDKRRGEFVKGRYNYFHTYKTHFSTQSKGKGRKIGSKSQTDNGKSRSKSNGNSDYVNKRARYADPSGKVAIKYLCGRRHLPYPLVKSMLNDGLIRSYSAHSTWTKHRVRQGSSLLAPGEDLVTLENKNSDRIINMIKDDINKHPKDYPQVNKHVKMYNTFVRYQELLVNRNKAGQSWPKLRPYLSDDKKYLNFIKFAKPRIEKYKKILAHSKPAYNGESRAEAYKDGQYIITNKTLFDYRDAQRDLTKKAINKTVNHKYPQYAKHYQGNYNAKEHMYFEPVRYYQPLVEFVHRIPPNKKVARSKGYSPKRETEVGADRIWLNDKLHTDQSMFNRGKEIVPKSFDHTVGFNFKTGPANGKGTLYVMEDSIDTLSRYALNSKTGYNENATYLSLEGVSKTEKIVPFLKAQCPKLGEYKNLVLCPDNDNAGHDMVERLISQIHDKSDGNAIKNPLTGNKMNVSVEVPGIAPYKAGDSRTYLKTPAVLHPKQFLHIKDYNDVLQELPHMESSLKRLVLQHPDSRMSVNQYSDYIIDNHMRELTGRGHTHNLNLDNPKRFSKFLCAYQGLYNHAPQMTVNNQNEFVKRMKFEIDHMSKTGRMQTLSFMNNGGGNYLSPKNLFHYSKSYEVDKRHHNISYQGLNRSSRELARSLSPKVDRAMDDMHSVKAKQGLAYALRSYVPILKASQYGAPKTQRDKFIFNLGYRLNQGSLKTIFNSDKRTIHNRIDSASDFYRARHCLSETVPAFNNSPGSNFDLIGQHATNYLVNHGIPTGHFHDFLLPQQKSDRSQSAGHSRNHSKVIDDNGYDGHDSQGGHNGKFPHDKPKHDSSGQTKNNHAKSNSKGGGRSNLNGMGAYYRKQHDKATHEEKRNNANYKHAVNSRVVVGSGQINSNGHSHDHSKDGRDGR